MIRHITYTSLVRFLNEIGKCGHITGNWWQRVSCEAEHGGGKLWTRWWSHRGRLETFYKSTCWMTQRGRRSYWGNTEMFVWLFGKKTTDFIHTMWVERTVSWESQICHLVLGKVFLTPWKKWPDAVDAPMQRGWGGKQLFIYHFLITIFIVVKQI